MDIASLFADPNLVQLESEAIINTDNAPSKRSADATAPLAPKARENPFFYGLKCSATLLPALSPNSPIFNAPASNLLPSGL